MSFNLSCQYHDSYTSWVEEAQTIAHDITKIDTSKNEYGIPYPIGKEVGGSFHFSGTHLFQSTILDPPNRFILKNEDSLEFNFPNDVVGFGLDIKEGRNAKDNKYVEDGTNEKDNKDNKEKIDNKQEKENALSYKIVITTAGYGINTYYKMGQDSSFFGMSTFAAASSAKTPFIHHVRVRPLFTKLNEFRGLDDSDENYQPPVLVVTLWLARINQKKTERSQWFPLLLSEPAMFDEQVAKEQMTRAYPITNADLITTVYPITTADPMTTADPITTALEQITLVSATDPMNTITTKTQMDPLIQTVDLTKDSDGTVFPIETHIRRNFTLSNVWFPFGTSLVSPDRLVARADDHIEMNFETGVGAVEFHVQSPCGRSVTLEINVLYSDNRTAKIHNTGCKYIGLTGRCPLESKQNTMRFDIARVIIKANSVFNNTVWVQNVRFAKYKPMKEGLSQEGQNMVIFDTKTGDAKSYEFQLTEKR